jgi:CBS domain-containing protein
MWKGNCGFLPVVGSEDRVVGVVTDRDICIALGTRGRPSGEVTVAEVMSTKVHSCAPEDEVRIALDMMRDGRVRRLPTKQGTLVGVISMDDVLLRAEEAGKVKETGVSSDDVVNALRAINTHQLPVVVVKQATA